jgi:hypothetical protein
LRHGQGLPAERGQDREAWLRDPNQQIDFSPIVNAAQAGVAKLIASLILATALAAMVRFLSLAAGRRFDFLGRALMGPVFAFGVLGLLYFGFVVQSTQAPGEQDVFSPFVVLSPFASVVLGSGALALATAARKASPPPAPGGRARDRRPELGFARNVPIEDDSN